MEVAVFDFIIACIKDIGFPIFITMYLIIRFEKTLKQNTTAINRMLDFIKSK